MSGRTILIEVPVETLDDALASTRGGADRLELCAALEVGGLTPSIGVLRAIKAASPLPVVCMVRPRSGGCRYSDNDFAVMMRDRDSLIENGADGVVFGFLDQDGAIDASRVGTFLSGIPDSVETVFHRAFDLVGDPAGSLEILIESKITRILTSGGKPAAPEGAGAIRKLVEQANGRIEIIGGGGIRLDNSANIVRETGLTQIHSSCRATAQDRSARLHPEIRFGLPELPPETQHRRTDAGLVACLRAALAEFRG
jgi:copper homeostasis protein